MKTEPDPYLAKRDEYLRLARDARRMIANAPARRPHLLHLVPTLVQHARKMNHQSIRNRSITIDNGNTR